MARSHTPLFPDHLVAGRYRLVQRLAGEGTTQVWEARDDVLTRPVAVTVLRRDSGIDDAFDERYRRVAVAARLAHPNVVATFDAGTEGELAFIVTERLRGRTLAQRLARGPRLTPADAVRIGIAVATALEHAHRAGLVHGGITPDTVAVIEDGAAITNVKVTDFGLTLVGPDPDPRTDILALGALLYEVCCGQPPVRSADGATPRPRKVRAGIPKPLDAAIVTALSPAPADRFASAAAFRAALEAIDVSPDDAAPVDAPVDRTPPTGTPPVHRRPRRSWVPLAALVVVAGAGLAVAIALVGSRHTTTGGGTAGAPGAPVHVAAIHSFDPEGDKTENEARAPLAIDGNPATVWSTDRYNPPRPFANLKHGVGLVLTLDRPHRLRQLKVTSSTQGWAAQIYVSDVPHPSLAEWGTPVASRTGLDGPATFDLNGHEGGAVLLWITDTGVDRKADVAEIVVST